MVPGITGLTLWLLFLVWYSLPVEAGVETTNSEVFAPIEAREARALRVGVVGLVHDHVNWILGREAKGDIEIVGIAEPNRELALGYSKKYGFSMDLVFPSIDAMVSATHPEAVTAFNAIYDHLETVRYCAPRGIHVMVEKPMAVNWEHAKEMAALARRYDIPVHLSTQASVNTVAASRGMFIMPWV